MATELERLLARLASERNAPLPEPAAPVGMIGPLSNDTSAAFAARNPEPVPPRLIAPAAPDQGFVNQYAGPAPTAPTIRQPGTLEKIAAILSGIGAGPEYGLALREERQRPFRDYERQQEQYRDRQARGFELAERQAEREADRINRANEANYEREYRAWLVKNADRSDEAKERVRQAYALELQARRQRFEVEEEQRRDRRQQERDAQTIANQYFTATKNRGLSQELGRYHAGLTGSLSPAAARLDRQLQDANGGVSRSRTGPVSNQARAAYDTWAMAQQGRIQALQRGDTKSAQAFKEAEMRAYKSMARFPGQIRLATTNPDWTWAEMVNAPAPAGAQLQAQPQQQADPLGILR